MGPHAWNFLPDFCSTIRVLIKAPERAFFLLHRAIKHFCDSLHSDGNLLQLLKTNRQF